MSHATPHRTQIGHKLAQLSSDKLQELVLRYAALRYPERFSRPGFLAFSIEGKSRPGWPDKAVLLADGRLDGVEATGAKDKAAVLAHLAEDLEKAAKLQPHLAGLLFVSGHPGVQLDVQELHHWHGRFVSEAGLDADKTTLLFGQALADDLADPAYARLCWDILGLPFKPRRFVPVRQELPWDSASPFIPSPQDYAAGRVYRPAVVEPVAEHWDFRKLRYTLVSTIPG